MKIFKYFLLLLLLGSFSLSIFMLTQNPAFKIEREFVVDAPKQVVYKYIEDIHLWNQWIPTTQHTDDIFQIEMDKVGTYLIQNEYKHPYDSLSQDVLNDKKISNIKWKFTDEQKATKIRLSFEGEMDLKTKLMTFFSGSPNTVVGQSMEKYTNALIVYFVKQFKEFSLTTKKQTVIEKQTVLFKTKRSTVSNLALDVALLYQDALEFCRENEISFNPNPLLVVSDLENDTITYEFSMVLNQDIFLNSDDQWQVKSNDRQTYYQGNLQGNYTHISQSVATLKREVEQLGLALDTQKPIVIELNEANFSSSLPSNFISTISIAYKSEQPTQEVAQ